MLHVSFRNNLSYRLCSCSTIKINRLGYVSRVTTRYKSNLPERIYPYRFIAGPWRVPSGISCSGRIKLESRPYAHARNAIKTLAMSTIGLYRTGCYLCRCGLAKGRSRVGKITSLDAWHTFHGQLFVRTGLGCVYAYRAAFDERHSSSFSAFHAHCRTKTSLSDFPFTPSCKS